MAAGFTHFLLLIFANISFLASSQVLDSNTIWSEAYRKLYYVENDTINLNTNTYHKINSYSDTLFQYTGSQETFLLRVAGEKVFWHSTFDNEDYLLYDFGLSVGDSVYVTPLSNYILDSVLLSCESVDSIDVMGIERRRLTMRTVFPSTYYNTDIEFWLWGIGSTLGLLNPGHLSFAFVDQTTPELFCCHKEFSQVYQSPTWTTCHGSTASIENSEFSSLSISPNPFDKHLTLVSNHHIDEICLNNLMSEAIEFNFDRATGQLHILNAQKGIYVLKIRIGTHLITKLINHN